MNAPTLLWLRRDLRVADHPALLAAIARGGPVVPVFVLDPQTEGWGAAPLWRLGESLSALSADLAARGSRLILRRGPALAVLRALAAETGARAVVWSRLYDPASKARDAEVKAALKGDGLEAASVCGTLLRDPWEVATGEGGFYRVYTPYWRAAAARDVPDPAPAPSRIPAPEAWPASDAPGDWRLGARMRRGAAVVARHVAAGEAAARERLDAFLAEGLAGYAEGRDRLDRPGTSRLSEALTLGEIGPRTVWWAAQEARLRGRGVERGAEGFLREIVWREFAWHLGHHTPHLFDANWRREWDAFPWRGDNPDAERWRRGTTGEPVIDAAMREMQVTGRMHNRARMLTASYLCKHLMTDWRVGDAFFRDHLVDWDPASNAMGWQWVAGSGPDAAPFFRIFNPATQAEKFDPDGAYRRRWIAEGARTPHPDALSFFDAAPISWELFPTRPYPAPMVDLKTGRERALAAYATLRAAA
jgi:deoxyribodipyrimidine photo-lyase